MHRSLQPILQVLHKSHYKASHSISTFTIELNMASDCPHKSLLSLFKISTYLREVSLLASSEADSAVLQRIIHNLTNCSLLLPRAKTVPATIASDFWHFSASTVSVGKTARFDAVDFPPSFQPPSLNRDSNMAGFPPFSSLHRPPPAVLPLSPRNRADRNGRFRIFPPFRFHR